MKTKLVTTTVALAAGLVLGGLALPSSTADAKIHHTTMPKALRGTWVHREKDNIGGDIYKYRTTIKATKYVYNYKYVVNGKTITKIRWSGKKKSPFYNHSDLSVKKLKKGRWRISWYKMNSDMARTYKRVKHNGKPAIVMLDHYLDGRPMKIYYYKQ